MKGFKVQRAILFVNPRKKNAQALANEIITELGSLDIKADVFSSKRKSTFETKESYDVAISLGGDGTVLSTARTMSPRKVPVFPINLGTFGFIAGVHPLEWREVLRQWLKGKSSISRRLMLEVTVERGGAKIDMGCCLNEVVISAVGAVKLITLEASYCSSGGKNVVKLGQYRSDGLIVSTPTGSTAYSAAAGGPIVDPELEAVILNFICPFTLTHRPLVLPMEEMVMIEVDREERKGVLLTIDGQVIEKLKGGDRIYIKKASYSCLLVASGRQGFFQALRTKLAWTGSNVEETP